MTTKNRTPSIDKIIKRKWSSLTVLKEHLESIDEAYVTGFNGHTLMTVDGVFTLAGSRIFFAKHNEE